MQKRSFGTHDGSFHADEVTACALLKLYDFIDKDKIHRTRDETVLKNCEYVCDVGGIYNPKLKRFDHHQKEYNGDLASAGMILLYLKKEGFMDLSLYDHLNYSLIKAIDAHDVGKMEAKGYSFSQIIANFLPSDYNSSMKEKNEAFIKAVEFAYGHLKRMQDRFFYTRNCLKKVEKVLLPKKKYIFFEESIPWLDAFFELGGESHPALFIIMPTQTHWKLIVVPQDNRTRIIVKMPFPLEWA